MAWSEFHTILSVVSKRGIGVPGIISVSITQVTSVPWGLTVAASTASTSVHAASMQISHLHACTCTCACHLCMKLTYICIMLSSVYVMTTVFNDVSFCTHTCNYSLEGDMELNFVSFCSS